MSITKESLQKLLIKRWDYSDHSASQTAGKLLDMDPELQIELKYFLKTDNFSNSYQLFGMTFNDIANAYPFKPPAVFLFFDWVKRDPMNALDAAVEEYHKPLPKSFNSQALKAYMSQEKKLSVD